MTHNFEAKKNGMIQTQDGIWKLSLTILPEDMPMELLQAPMGTPYGLAMVKIDYDNPTVKENLTVQNNNELSINERSEGDKLRVRAVMLCKDKVFKLFIQNSHHLLDIASEDDCRYHTCGYCKIKSRSELTTNEEAQKLFKQLHNKFTDWKFEQNHSSNLEREYI